MIWIKKFRKRKVQSVMIFLMVLICSLLMTGSMIILSSLDKPYSELAEETDAPQLRVFPVQEEELESELKKLESVQQVTKKRRCFLSGHMSLQGKKIDLFSNIIKYDADFSKHVRLLEGNLDGLSSRECAVPSTMANNQGISLGDTLTLEYGDATYDYKVKAIFASVYSLNVAYNMDVILTEIPQPFELSDFYEVYTKEGKSGTDVVKEYADNHNGILSCGFDIREDVISNAHITENILGAVLLALSLVIFLVSLIMIRYMIRNAILRDGRVIAIYKAIGYTDRSICGIYLTFYQMLVFAGAAFGTLCSPVISSAFMQAAFENLGIKGGASGIRQGILCMAVINLLVFLQINMEIRKIRRQKPVELLSGNTQELGLKKTKQKSRNTQLHFSPFAMAARMLQRDKKNTAFIILTCFLSVYMVNMAVVCFSNIADMRSNNYYWLGFDKHDISLTNKGDQDQFEKLLQEVKEDDEALQVIGRKLNMDILIPYQQSVTAMVYETYDGLDVPLVEGVNPRDSNEVVIGNLYARELNKEIGDYLEIYLSPEKKADLLIVGTCQGYYNMGKVIRLKSSLFEENKVDFAFSEASVYVKEGTDRNAFARRIEDKYTGNVEAVPREELYLNIMAQITDPQEAALGPFVVLAVLLGALNLVYIIYLKNYNERKTYSIYKSIGYPAGHLVKMNCWYVGIIASVSMAAALPVFMLCFPKVMVLSMSAFGFTEYRVTYDLKIMLLANAVVLLVFLLSVILSSRELYQNNMEELVTE